MTSARLLFGGLALAGLLLTLVEHVGTWFGLTLLVPGPLASALLLVQFVVFCALIAAVVMEIRSAGAGGLRLRERFPGWALPVVLVVTLYGGASFLYHAFSSGGASAVVDGDGYHLLRPGQPAQPITAGEYHAWRVRRAHAESGYSLVFLLVPAIWFLARRAR